MQANLLQPTGHESQAKLLCLLQVVPFLRHLPEQIHMELANRAICRAYGADEVIFLEGDATVGLYIVAEGTVKIHRMSIDGREHILQVFGPGDTFNDVGAMDGGPNPVTAQARTESAIWCIPRTALKELARQYPELAWAMLESMASRTRYLVNVVQDLAMRSVRGRLARLLLNQAEGDMEAEMPRLLTQEEMASRLGTVREMVGRTLRGLAADEIIEFDRHRIVILDVEKLRHEAEA